MDLSDGFICAECSGEDDSAAKLAEPMAAPVEEHVLYSSDPAGCTPSYDRGNGGSPTNYSPPIRVRRACNIPLVGKTQSLKLRFRNGVRNMHIQGGKWPDAEPCELELCVYFDGASY